MAYTWNTSVMGVPMVEDYMPQDDSNIIETPMSVGPPRFTLTSAEKRYVGTCSLMCSYTQMVTWNLYIWEYSAGINRGTIPIENFPLDLGYGSQANYTYLKNPRFEVIGAQYRYKLMVDFISITNTVGSP